MRWMSYADGTFVDGRIRLVQLLATLAILGRGDAGIPGTIAGYFRLPSPFPGAIEGYVIRSPCQIAPV
ncbi:MAG: hypothetical protein KF777_04130 [Planctomycetaceae bacterium]|nr:hypothetical protein [Planctomycetaceae bacterium]